MGTIWVLDANVLRSALAGEIAKVEESGERVPAESMKVMEALAADESDVVAWVGSDGRLVLRSIVVGPAMLSNQEALSSHRTWIGNRRLYSNPFPSQAFPFRNA